MNIADLLIRSARWFPARPAVTWRGLTTDYASLNRRTASLAEGMRGLGVVPGSRIVVLMDNRPELLETFFAAFRLGAAVVPCNPRATADDLAYLIEDSDAALVTADQAHASIVAGAVTGRPVLCTGDGYEALAAAGRGRQWDAEDLPPDALAWVFYTSGTTGRPKGAMLSHGVLSFVTVGWLADLTPLDERDVTLHAAPLTHGAGFHALAATARAASQVLLDHASFDPETMLEVMWSAGVTNTWLVPTQIIRFAEVVDASGKGAPPTLSHVVYGGAPITPSALQRAIDLLGPVFVQLYGQGETPMTATVLRREDHVEAWLGAAGRPRVGIDVRIADEDGHDLPAGEVGEVVVRGPSVMLGYWNRPDATREAIRDGWLRTGDLGRMGEDGMLFLLDRTKDLIISGGSNVYAVEVEAALASFPGLRDAAVIGIADDLWGERVEAVVVLEDPSLFDEVALDRHCRERLADYKIPRRYHSSDGLPRNPYGKVLKGDLRSSLGPAQIR